MSRRDANDAHFLHQAKALEPVLAVPAEAPRALSWLRGKEVLLVAQQNGTVLAVEPSFGARTLFSGPPEPVHLASQGARVAVLTATGRLMLRGEDGGVELELDSGLGGASGVRFWAGGVAIVGDIGEERQVRVYEGGRCVRALRVPEGTTLGTLDGELRLARSVEAGLRVVPLGSALPGGPATQHLLRFASGGRVLGVAEGGVTVWEDELPRTVRLLDSHCGALAQDGRTLALGTRGGVVAIADVLGPPAQRGHPPRLEAHAAPVAAMSFSSRGRWLATVGENCRLWAY